MQPLRKMVQKIHKKLNIQLPCDLAISLFWVYTQKDWKWGLRDICTPIAPNSINHNSQKVGATQWPQTDQRTNKKGILFSLQKEGNSHIGYNINDLWGHYTKWNEPVTKRQILYDSFHLDELPKVAKFKETKTKMVVNQS